MRWPLTAKMAPLVMDDLNTDVIYPARFLLVLDREDLGNHAFADLREHPDFVLDAPEYAGAGILLTGRGFGSGSSREHAVWAVAGRGFSVVVALGFGDIFYRNCVENGLLPITVDEPTLAKLAALAREGSPVTVDLENGMIRTAEGDIPFAVTSTDRERLLSGQSTIERVEAHAEARSAFCLYRRYPEASIGSRHGQGNPPIDSLVSGPDRGK